MYTTLQRYHKALIKLEWKLWASIRLIFGGFNPKQIPLGFLLNLKVIILSFQNVNSRP